MKQSLRNLSDDAIFNIISSDFESSDGQSRWDDIEETTEPTPEPTEAQILEESFEGKTDAELFALISNDCESSDGQSRYKNCARKTVKKTNKPVNKSNREKPMNNTMTKITLASGKTLFVESNHAARLQKSIGDLSESTRARVERARRRIQNKDTFVASIKNPHGRTYNQLASWVSTIHSEEKATILASDEDRIVYSV